MRNSEYLTAGAPTTGKSMMKTAVQQTDVPRTGKQRTRAKTEMSSSATMNAKSRLKHALQQQACPGRGDSKQEARKKKAAGAPMKEKSRMKTAAKAPPSKNALTMVRGSVRNARSVSTLQQG